MLQRVPKSDQGIQVRGWLGDGAGTTYIKFLAGIKSGGVTQWKIAGKSVGPSTSTCPSVSRSHPKKMEVPRICPSTQNWYVCTPHTSVAQSKRHYWFVQALKSYPNKTLEYNDLHPMRRYNMKCTRDIISLAIVANRV